MMQESIFYEHNGTNVYGLLLDKNKNNLYFESISMKQITLAKSSFSTMKCTILYNVINHIQLYVI